MARLIRPIDDRGPVVALRIGLTRPQAAERRRRGLAALSSLDVPALIDTGASTTAIDPYIVQALELISVARSTIHTPSGVSAEEYELYRVQLKFAEPEIPDFAAGLRVVGCSRLSANGYLMLLGRDVLDRGVFTYDGPAGTFTLDY